MPLVWLLQFLIRCYQLCLSPWLGTNCRFYPSCSQYALLCLKQDHFLRALYKIGGRILRCHPWHPGGVDLP